WRNWFLGGILSHTSRVGEDLGRPSSEGAPLPPMASCVCEYASATVSCGEQACGSSEMLERQLDFALVKVVAYERLYNPDAQGGVELVIVRHARDYRLHHPWTSQPDIA